MSTARSGAAGATDDAVLQQALLVTKNNIVLCHHLPGRFYAKTRYDEVITRLFYCLGRKYRYSVCIDVSFTEHNNQNLIVYWEYCFVLVFLKQRCISLR